MKKWYALLAIFVAVFLGSRWYFSHHRGLPDIGPLPPGNPVDVYLARSALVVDGDVADPLVEAKLFHAGEPHTEIPLTDVLNTPTRVLFFFDVKPGEKYEARIQTQHRPQRSVELEATANPASVEVARIALPAGEEPGGIGLSDDDKTLFVSVKDKTRAYRVADGKDIPADKANGPYKNKGTSSEDGRLVAIIEAPTERKPAHSDWQVVVFH